ncbi:hypothetical protein GCM10022209_44230 [Chitinophaga oryziterrae]
MYSFSCVKYKDKLAVSKGNGLETWQNVKDHNRQSDRLGDNTPKGNYREEIEKSRYQVKQRF